MGRKEQDLLIELTHRVSSLEYDVAYLKAVNALSDANGAQSEADDSAGRDTDEDSMGASRPSDPRNSRPPDGGGQRPM